MDDVPIYLIEGEYLWVDGRWVKAKKLEDSLGFLFVRWHSDGLSPDNCSIIHVMRSPNGELCVKPG